MEATQRSLVEACLRQLAEHPHIVGAHLCLGDSVASSVQTEEKKTRPTVALTPNWVVLVESGGEVAALEQTCAELLPEGPLVDAGAFDLASGLYQLQFEAK